MLPKPWVTVVGFLNVSIVSLVINALALYHSNCFCRKLTSPFSSPDLLQCGKVLLLSVPLNNAFPQNEQNSVFPTCKSVFVPNEILCQAQWHLVRIIKSKAKTSQILWTCI